MNQIPDDVFAALYPSVGAIVITWSLAEQALQGWVAVIYKQAGGDTIAAEVPRQYGRMNTFLCDCFRQLPSLSEFKEEAITILSKLATLSDIRHTVIHGAISRYERATETLVFSRVDTDRRKGIRPNTHIHKEESYTFQQLLAAHEECIVLTSRILAISKRLIETFAPGYTIEDTGSSNRI